MVIIHVEVTRAHILISYRLEERGIWRNPKEKRWWGAFNAWLSKITTLEVDKSQTRSFCKFPRQSVPKH